MNSYNLDLDNKSVEELKALKLYTCAHMEGVKNYFKITESTYLETIKHYETLLFNIEKRIK